MNLILVIAALVVSWLVFTWFWKVMKTTIGTALLVAAIVLGLQLLFGIGPNQLMQQIGQLPQMIFNLFKGGR